MVAHAATIEVWRSEVSGRPATNQFKVTIQGTVCRIDFSTNLTCLLDGHSGYAYQMLHPARAYVRQPLEEFAALSPCSGATNEPVATGASNVISGYVVFEYQLVLPCGTHTYWVAPDYPHWKQFQDETAAGQSFAAKAGFHNFSQALPGMVLRTKSIMQDANGFTAGVSKEIPLTTNISTLVSISTVADDPALANIPLGYREVQDLNSIPPVVPAQMRGFEQEKAWAKRMASPGASRMGSLSGQFNSGSFPQIAPPPASYQGAPKLFSVQNQSGPVSSPPAYSGNTFALNMTSWGQHGEQAAEVIITNSTAAKLLWSNAQNAVVLGQSNQFCRRTDRFFISNYQ